MTPIQKAMLKAGLIKQEDLPSVQLKKKKVAADTTCEFPKVPWKKPPSGKIVEKGTGYLGDKKEQEEETTTVWRCIRCGQIARDQDNMCRCGGEIAEVPATPRRTGHMVWTHKTAPTFQFDDNPTMTPEDYTGGRRR